MSENKLEIIYVFDALCGWCYGFSPVIKHLYQEYHDQFNFEVLSGGMVLGESAGPIGKMADLIKSHYPNVEYTCGVKFGEPFLTALNEGTRFFSSEKPSKALSVFKSYFPDQAVLFAHDIQNAIYLEGLDLSEDSSYEPLVAKYNIDKQEFIQKLNSEEFKQAAYYDFALARQLQVSGYPAAFIKTGDTNFYMIARGYTDLATMKLRVENVLKELGK
jgi:putative protein-disulfide isomerase